MEKLKGIGVTVLIIGALVGYKFYNKGATGDDIKTTMHEWIANAPGYSEDSAYYDQLFEAAHPGAFEKNYRMGGRRRGAKFDDTKYIDDLCNSMCSKARADERPEVVIAIETVRSSYHAAPAN